MSHATGYEKLTGIVLAQLHGHIFAVGGASATQVHGYVKHRAAADAHELGLAELPFLEVQTAKHAACRH